MFTFATGWLIVLTKLGHDHVALDSGYMTRILSGGLLGTLMWANVWFVIWPAQQVVIANATNVAAGGTADPGAAARGARSGLASRTNTLFSIPMLFFMGAASHFTSLAMGTAVGVYWICFLVVVLAVEANMFSGSAATQKPLSTVGGTIHMGILLTIVLYVLMVVIL
jgi:uncharacterized membrane protein